MIISLVFISIVEIIFVSFLNFFIFHPCNNSMMCHGFTCRVFTRAWILVTLHSSSSSFSFSFSYFSIAQQSRGKPIKQSGTRYSTSSSVSYTVNYKFSGFIFKQFAKNFSDIFHQRYLSYIHIYGVYITKHTQIRSLLLSEVSF